MYNEIHKFMKIDKKKVLKTSKKHVLDVRKNIKIDLLNREGNHELNLKKLKTAQTAEIPVLQQVIFYDLERKKELKKLFDSPYFSRCDVLFDDEDNSRAVYFSKFNFTENSIYSWVAPISQVRFGGLGDFSFELPNGKVRKGLVLRKDDFFIEDGKILFLTSESSDYPKELIYQEHFSTQKKDFLLPEIVSQMERAQDMVIRARHKGSFLITGPAGSGKTTLALHRIAYLRQSPETRDLYPTKEVIVFVQDVGTKEYFSQLLPELGIDNVKIVTFSEWAMDILGIKNIKFSVTYGDSEENIKNFKSEKNKTLVNFSQSLDISTKNPHAVLESIYKKEFSEESLKLFKQQRSKKVLDRFDLTLLLKMYKNQKKKYPEYSLVLLDEFQNYLPDQIKIIQSCVSKINESVIYVGDIAQKIHFGTIRSLKQIQEIIPNERKVVLDKVYRNTKPIMEYIAKKQFTIEIPEKARDGALVKERKFKSREEEIFYIKKVIKNKDSLTVGILARDEKYLEEFKNEFGGKENIHLFDIRQAQGVEFDTVFLVGVDKGVYTNEISDEWDEIERRIFYVGLTRAINELHVLERK